MDKTVKTKRIRYAKVGEVIGVPLGMILKTAVLLNRVFVDDEGQIVGEGVVVEREGFSKIRIGWEVGVCLGWK